MNRPLRQYAKWALTQGKLCKGSLPALRDTLNYCIITDPTYTETLLCSTIESKILIQKLSLIINNKVGHNISPILMLVLVQSAVIYIFILPISGVWAAGLRFPGLVMYQTGNCG